MRFLILIIPWWFRIVPWWAYTVIALVALPFLTTEVWTDFKRHQMLVQAEKAPNLVPRLLSEYTPPYDLSGAKEVAFLAIVRKDIGVVEHVVTKYFTSRYIVLQDAKDDLVFAMLNVATREHGYDLIAKLEKNMSDNHTVEIRGLISNIQRDVEFINGGLSGLKLPNTAKVLTIKYFPGSRQEFLQAAQRRERTNILIWVTVELLILGYGAFRFRRWYRRKHTIDESEQSKIKPDDKLHVEVSSNDPIKRMR